MKQAFHALFLKHADSIVRAAGAMKRAQREADPDSWVDYAKQTALEELADFDEELARTPYSLDLEDMKAVAHVIIAQCGLLCPSCGHANCPDACDKWEGERLDTRYGNECLALEMGVVAATLIAKSHMLREIGKESRPIALYLEHVYERFAIDPADRMIAKITEDFYRAYPKEASRTFELLDRKTTELRVVIDNIPQDTDYFAKHIFAHGFNDYPGIGFEVHMLVEQKAGRDLLAT